jgi:hypothetical protein
MKTIKTIIACMSLLGCFYACENHLNHPIENNPDAPGKVTITQVEEIAGGAVITYVLPEDPDLLYIMARYTENGVNREFKASFYTNYLVVDGMSKEAEYTVDLYAVNRSEKYSEPVSIKMRPLTPPIIGVFESLKYKATFGGISISYENPSGAFMAVGVLTLNEEGKQYEPYTHYSSQPYPSFPVRGFKAEEREFWVYVKDKWGNTSDTVSYVVTPIGEKELDKSLFREMKLKGDADPTSWGGQMRFIWDGRAFGDNEGDWGLHTGNVATGKPMYITFDLGVTATLSRFKLWVVMDDKHMYNDVSPRKYEIWGRSYEINPTTDNGEFYPHWFKMGEIENIKPSGLPSGSLTDDDRAAARAGDELVFEDFQPTTRYIRIVCLLNWNGNTNMVFSEVSFWEIGN